MSFSAATSAKSPFALSSSFAFFASPISFDAAFRRACAASAAWIAVRRFSSSAISRCACGSSPRRANPRSKAAGFSRMKRMSCMFLSRHPEVRAKSAPRRMKGPMRLGRRPSRRPRPVGVAPQGDGPNGRWNAGSSPTMTKQNHSAGLAAAAASEAARSAAARFSTQRTDQTEPSYKATSGSASDIWLNTSGGVSTAAMTKAMTMK